MDNWGSSIKRHYLKKKFFYSHINMEDITDAEEYHDLYVQSDTLLLDDVFKNFRNMYLEIYEIAPAFSYRIKISMKRSLKKTRVNLMVEKGVRDGIRHAIH